MSILSFNDKNAVKILSMSLCMIPVVLCMLCQSATAAIESPWSCDRPSLEGVYALYPDTGQLQVGNAAPDFNTYDNTTLYQIYEDVAEVLNPAFITAPVIAITDRSLQLNAENGSTAFLTLMYIDSTTYFENDTLDPVLFGGGGTAWNVCVWEGCPTDSSTGGSTGKIVCAYGQSNAFRHLIPFFDDGGNLVHLQMNWIQSNNILREAGLPGNQSDLVLFVSLLTRVGDLPSDTPVPEPETE